MAAVLRFRDEPREDSRSLVQHLAPRHGVKRVMLVSGDRVAEVEDLGHADRHHGDPRRAEPGRQGPDRPRGDGEGADAVRRGRDQRRARRSRRRRLDWRSGAASDIIAEAAGAVLLDTSLVKVDELFHIARRLRRIALQSAVLGMALSAVGMGFAAAGFLSPVAGRCLQEVIDVLAIANALRASRSPARLHDYARPHRPLG